MVDGFRSLCFTCLKGRGREEGVVLGVKGWVTYEVVQVCGTLEKHRSSVRQLELIDIRARIHVRAIVNSVVDSDEIEHLEQFECVVSQVDVSCVASQVRQLRADFEVADAGGSCIVWLVS